MIEEIIQRQIQRLPYSYKKELLYFAEYLSKKTEKNIPLFREEILPDSLKRQRLRSAVRKALIDGGLVSSELKPHVSLPLTSEQREELANLFSGEPMLSDIILEEREGR